MNFDVNNSVNNVNMSLGGVSNSGNNNIGFLFAQLQMELAQANKDKALNQIEQIRSAQNESATFTSAINTLNVLSTTYDFDKYGGMPSLNNVAKELKNTQHALDAINGALPKASDKKCISIDEDANKYMIDLGDHPGYEDIRRGNCDNKHYKYELEGAKKAMEDRLKMLTTLSNLLSDPQTKQALSKSNIDFNTAISSDAVLKTMVSSLQNVQETVGTDIQQQMVFVQDFMGQYNSYTQGSSSVISQSMETLKTVARGS